MTEYDINISDEQARPDVADKKGKETMKNRKKIWTFSAMGLGVLALCGAVVAASLEQNKKATDPYGADETPTYALTLNSSLAIGGKAEANATTAFGNTITLKADGVSARDGAFGEFAVNGYVYNDSQLTGLKTITVDMDSTGTVGTLTVALGVEVSGVISYDTIAPQTLSADGSISIASITTMDVAHFKISNLGSSVCDVTSITLNYACTKAKTNYQPITYNVEGVAAETVYVVDGSTFASAYTPTLDGYTFNGWVDNTSGTSATGTIISAATTLKASWLRNVEESVSGSVQHYCYDYSTKPWTTCTLSTGATWDDARTEYLMIGGSVANTNYAVTMPAFDYASVVAAGGEVSFDLSTKQGWEHFYVEGGEIHYEAEHKSDDPLNPTDAYRVSIRSNGVGLGVYATSTSYSNFGEIATLSSDVANGTTGLVISFYSEAAGRQVYIGRMSYYTLDYGTVVSNALATLTTTESLANLVAYDTAVSQNLTPYEKTQYSVPAVVTTAKTNLAGQSQAAFAFPTISFTDTDTYRKQLGENAAYTDTKWGALTSGDTTDTVFTNAWSLQIASGKTNSYFEFPKLNYAVYGKLTFKTWMGTNGGKVYANGNLVDSSNDCANQDWNYVVEIVTSGSSTVLTIYHGNGAKAANTTVMGTWTLTADVINGQTPLRLVRAVASTAWAPDEIWGLTSMKGVI